MRVLFYEPNPAGHHFAYFARMLPGFLKLPIQVGLATTQAAIESEEYAKFLSKFEDDLEILPICSPLARGQLRNAWQRCRDVARAVDAWQPDHLCILYGDGLWQLATLARSLGSAVLGKPVVTEAWMYRGGFSYPAAQRRADALKRRLFQRLLQQGLFDRIHFDDELLLHFVEQLPPAKTEVVLTPNPILFCDPLDCEAARERLRLPSDGRLISSSGMVTRRKGMHLVLEAYAAAFRNQQHEQQSDQLVTRLLLAGPHDEKIKAMLASEEYRPLVQRGWVISQDRYLDETEMFETAAASDLVLAAYPNHSGRSSIILWAAAAGRPVLGVNRGCIDYVIREESLGETCDVKNIKEFSQALISTLEGPWTEDDVQRVRRYAQWHSIENYQRLAADYVATRIQNQAD